jgi:hypothetical protein
MAAMAMGMMARAQSSAPCTLGVSARFDENAYPNTGFPYTDTIRTTREQKLEGGNAIHGSTVTHQARDSSGKRMTESLSGCVRGEGGKAEAILRFDVVDPATKTSFGWTVGAGWPKVVQVSHLPERVRKPPTAEESAEIAERRRVMLMHEPPQSETRMENLGSKTINGVVAEGIRTVRTIPAGEEGNDLPIEVLNESWTSKEIGLTLLRIMDDPRYGRIVTEIEELNRTEPDPALFTPPSDYKLEEQVTKPVSAAGAQ